MPLSIVLAKALGITEDCTDEETSTAIVAHITSAIHDSPPRLSLDEIYSTITNSGCAQLLDPLNTLPLLLPCRDKAASDIITLIGECSSAKEVVIAVQEAAERLVSFLCLDLETNLDEHTYVSPPTQLIRLVHLYSSSIPRLKLRRKCPSETIRSLLYELESVIQLAGGQASRTEGRELIMAISCLIRNVVGWLDGSIEAKDDELVLCRQLLKSLVDSTVTNCSQHIASSLAQRSFEACFPRLIVRSAVEPGWEEGEKVISCAMEAYGSLGIILDILPTSPSIAHLVLLAHSPQLSFEADRLLSSMLPVILASVQTNTALDESLSLLLLTLHRTSSHSPKTEISPLIIIPLITLLPSLASAHPDPPVRHLTFRLLSLLLSLAPSQLRIRILHDLVSDSDFPQMRVAAIHLVKEAVLEAISPSAPTPNTFASPNFLQVFGPVLLRPNPPDLFSSGLSAHEFQESSEPQRLVECLSLFYILLQRDKNNQTGIRDSQTIFNAEGSLLAPLRSSLEKWLDDSGVAQNQLDTILPLISLQMSVERVDDAIGDLVHGTFPG